MCIALRRILCNRSPQSFLCLVTIVAIVIFLYFVFFGNTRRLVTLHYNPSHFYVESYPSDGNGNGTRKSLLNVPGIGNVVNKSRAKQQKILSDESIFKFGRTVQNVYCDEIFKGNTTEIEYASQLYNNETLFAIKPTEYVQMASDCEKFTLERNYILEPLTDEERDFPIAFSILMYRDVEQFERLLRAIYRPQNSYCIHVDLGSNQDVVEAVSAIANCFPNVHMAPQRFLVKWGEMSVLQPEIVCMKILHEKNKLWKYFINLTGQEFPLKTNYELVKILKAYNGANDVWGTRKTNKERWEGRGDPPHGIIPTKGAVHVVLCRGFVEYIVNNQKAKDFLKWLEKTEIPDETLFPSLNFNPHLKVPGSYTGDLETKPFLARYKIWRGGPCGGKYVRNICIFGVKDLQEMANKKDLFANKFMWDYQRAAYGCMEELLYNRTRDEYFGKIDFDASWYGRLEFVKNKI